jgi:SAM-dependent methyltransferase
VHDERDLGHASSVQYATDVNLAARQRLWHQSQRDPALDLYEWVLDVAAVRPGERVADIGCGNGPYLALVPGAVGVDLSLGMLAAARDRVGNPLACGDAAALPLRTSSVDVALVPHVLYHVPDRAQAARELRRVVRDGGRCVAVTNGGRARQELKDLVEDAVGTGWRWGDDGDGPFKLENGAEQLRAGFDHVERIDAPVSTTYVTEADLLADYVGSVGDLLAPLAGVPWAGVVDDVRRRAAEIIERDGAFRITGSVGAFICS